MKFCGNGRSLAGRCRCHIRGREVWNIAVLHHPPIRRATGTALRAAAEAQEVAAPPSGHSLRSAARRPCSLRGMEIVAVVQRRVSRGLRGREERESNGGSFEGGRARGRCKPPHRPTRGLAAPMLTRAGALRSQTRVCSMRAASDGRFVRVIIRVIGMPASLSAAGCVSEHLTPQAAWGGCAASASIESESESSVARTARRPVRAPPPPAGFARGRRGWRACLRLVRVQPLLSHPPPPR